MALAGLSASSIQCNPASIPRANNLPLIDRRSLDQRILTNEIVPAEIDRNNELNIGWNESILCMNRIRETHANQTE